MLPESEAPGSGCKDSYSGSPTSEGPAAAEGRSGARWMALRCDAGTMQRHAAHRVPDAPASKIGEPGIQGSEILDARSPDAQIPGAEVAVGS